MSLILFIKLINNTNILGHEKQRVEIEERQIVDTKERMYYQQVKLIIIICAH